MPGGLQKRQIKNKGDVFMVLHGTNVRQIRKGVYFATNGREVRIGKNRYQYSLPKGSVVIPKQNLVYIKMFKGVFEWQYLPQKDYWIIKQIGGSGAKITDIDLKNLPDKCLFQMVVAIQECNRVFVFYPTENGDTITEWRYFNDFFTGIIRNGDIV